jgi:predicted O-linked N-acetylglucosamine transferase (SPINDLY family)
MGVPVVTLAGRTGVGRAGVSILSNLGLEALIAATPAEYVRIARELAEDCPRLRELRAELRPRMERSPLKDGPQYAAEIDVAFRWMWKTWCAR